MEKEVYVLHLLANSDPSIAASKACLEILQRYGIAVLSWDKNPNPYRYIVNYICFTEKDRQAALVELEELGLKLEVEEQKAYVDADQVWRK